VSIKPGKPFLFAKKEGSRPVLIFGLPGNPVSAFVTFQIFVRPALLRWMGAADVALPQAIARLDADIANPGDRPHYLRGRLHAGAFTPQGLQESHALFGLGQANALLRLERGEARKRDDLVVVHPWSL
jgi:molybdopterin molybdotransferase